MALLYVLRLIKALEGVLWLVKHRENKKSLKPKPQGFPEYVHRSKPGARYLNDTLGLMQDQRTAEIMLGTARLQPYLNAAAGDYERAVELYLWSAEISGALHTQLSFVEIAVRNALDPVLADWNTAQGVSYGRDWTAQDQAAPLLYDIIQEPLNRARRWARKETQNRPTNHPRKGVTPTHDDVLVQLTFGVWSSLVYVRGDNTKRVQLWEEATHRAFPHAPDSAESQQQIGQQLSNIQALRNRVAHHDNLLDVALGNRLNWTLSLLSKINPDYPSLAMARSQLRRLIREDPRRTW